MSRSIEEIKAEIVMRVLQGSLSWSYTKKLPKNDELRTFICQFDPYYAYTYACYVDKGPHDETRKPCCRDPYEAYYYARFVDKCPREDTREAACRSAETAYCYAMYVDKCAREDTGEAAYRDPSFKQYYIEKFGE